MIKKSTWQSLHSAVLLYRERRHCFIIALFPCYTPQNSTPGSHLAMELCKEERQMYFKFISY